MAAPSDLQWQQDHIHDDRSNDIVISHAIVLPLAVIAVILRFVSRRICRAAIKADDYMIILALVLAAMQTGGGLLSVHAGAGKHVAAVKDPARLNKIILATQLFYTPAIATVKLSVLLLYRRVFPSVRFRKILWGIGGFIICYAVPQELTAIFQCRPINGAWDPAAHANAKCIRLNLDWVIMASLNVLTDIVTLCVPLPLVWRLQIDLERKIQLIGVFLLGSFVCVVSIYRVPKIWEISLSDPGWTDIGAWVWSEVEVCVAIICACLPTLRALLNPSFYQRGNSTGPGLVHMERLRTATPEESPRRTEAVDDDDGLYRSKPAYSHIAEVPSSPLK